jgi:prepilin-type N-terminal cleavage/methylation domain-containing protein
MKIKNKKNKGFTMVELIISTSILSLIFGGMTIFGIQMIKSNKRTQELKNTVDNVGYAIEFISKMTRTSHNINSDNEKELFIKDNRENNSYCYLIDGDNKLKRKAGDNSAMSCSDIDSSNYVEVAGTEDIEIDGFFKVIETDRSAGIRGFVQLNIVLSNKDSVVNFSEKDDEMVIQTLVSLRDYGFN